MEEKDKKAEEKQAQAQPLQPSKRVLKRKAKWKLGAMVATLVMCSLLMLQLVVDEPSEAELIIYDYAREHKISALQYPESLVKLLERNPETRKFVLGYRPEKEQAVAEINMGGFDRSSGVPQFMQWDDRWGYMKYGTDMVAITGDGPMCLAMVGYYLTGDATFYPDRVVKFADESEFDLDGGSKWSIVTQGGLLLGLEAKELSAVEDKVGTYLNSGKPIIAVMGPGVFGDREHFIVMTGYSDGKVKVNDPASYKNSTEWEFSEIRRQIKSLWVIQKAED